MNNEEFNTNPGQPDTTLTNEKENKKDEITKEMIETVTQMRKAKTKEEWETLKNILQTLIEKYNQ